VARGVGRRFENTLAALRTAESTFHAHSREEDTPPCELGLLEGQVGVMRLLDGRPRSRQLIGREDECTRDCGRSG
jgi:hypothetical protein